MGNSTDNLKARVPDPAASSFVQHGELFKEGLTKERKRELLAQWLDGSDLSDGEREMLSQAYAPDDDSDPWSVQVGGTHYAECEIQPAQYISANGMGFMEGCIVKRLTRYNRSTGKGMQDLKKALHEIQLLIASVEQYGIRQPQKTE